MLEENTALGDPQIFEWVLQIKPEFIRIGQGSRIDSFVKLEGGVALHIGRYVHIASFAHLNIGGGVTIIEDYCAIASGGKLVSGGNLPAGQSMSASAPAFMQTISRGQIVMEKYSCVCTNAVVLANVTLREGAVLAAGSVATRDIPPWEIWAGVPARKVRVRRGIQDQSS